MQGTQANYLRSQMEKRIPTRFQAGQQVLLRDQTAYKLHAPYIGPYRVKKVVSDKVVVIEDENGKLDTVHVNYLKPFITRDGSPMVRQRQLPDDPLSKEEIEEFMPGENTSEEYTEFPVNVSSDSGEKLKKQLPRDGTSVIEARGDPKSAENAEEAAEISSVANDADSPAQLTPPPGKPSTAGALKTLTRSVRSLFPDQTRRQVNFETSELNRTAGENSIAKEKNPNPTEDNTEVEIGHSSEQFEVEPVSTPVKSKPSLFSRTKKLTDRLREEAQAFAGPNLLERTGRVLRSKK